MLTFLHLSDIHFINRDHGTQFDLDQRVRRALWDDIGTKPADGAAYDAVLITGDIAYSGQHGEYNLAREFLDQLYQRIGDLAANTFMVPGNHDVDRNFVSPDLPLWAAHRQLRDAQDPAVWRDHIHKQLVKDPLHSLLAPLKAYNDFAQGFGCFTGMVPPTKPGEPEVPQIAWQRVLETPLDDGTLVQLHGLNSVLVSDAGDAPGNLLVSEFQTARLENRASVVNLAMCHHPPEWLMDKAAVRNALRSFAPVSLFGHEHTTRTTADQREVHLFAGAVQPSRRDPGWLPTYHIVQLAIAADAAQRKLVVRVHTREFTEDAPSRFRPRRNEQEATVEEFRIDLPSNRLPAAPALLAGSAPPCERSSDSNEAMSATEPRAPSPVEAAQHQLLVHFFQLPTPKRYEAAFKAALLRDGDDALDPQAMWAEVFRRAHDENRLNVFWATVAAHIPAMKDKPNPFAKQNHA